MNFRKALLALTCLVAATGLIMGMAGQWRLVSLAASALLAVAWALKPLRHISWLASLSLGVYLLIAAAGLTLEGEPIFLVIGGMAALATWDLILFGRNLEGAENNAGLHRCTLEHFKSLGIAFGLAALLVIPVLLIRIQLPFFVMLVVLAIAATGILLAYRFLKMKNTP